MANFLTRILGGMFATPDPVPQAFVGFSTDGGVIPGGVTGTTALGLSSVWRCLDILSNGVSQLPWIERVGNLEVPPSNLVRKPQPDYTRREWVSLVVSTLALYDVCYLLKTEAVDEEGVPMALIYIDPRIIAPSVADAFSILPPQEFYIGNTRVRRDQLVILHRSPQPGVSDDLGGVLRMARITFAAAISANGYASRYWQAGGPPTNVLEMEGPITDEQAQNLSERYAAMRHIGPDYPAVFGSGLKIHPLGADPTMQTAREERDAQVADVGRYFGIGSSLLNSPNQSSQTYSTTEGDGIHLVTYTLQNYINALEDAITEQLPSGRNVLIDPARLYRGTLLTQAQAYQLATGGKAWMFPEDVRDAWGLAPVEHPEKLNPPAPVPVIAGGQNA